MTIRELIRKMNRFRPTSQEEFEDAISLNLVHLDSGCFREAYVIKGTRIVIKFNLDPAMKYHARREMRVIKRIFHRKSLRHLRRYVPKVYYQDYKNGVIVMELLSKVGKISAEAGGVIDQMFQDTFKRGGSDANYTNLGKNGRGQIKVLDLGCCG